VTVVVAVVMVVCVVGCRGTGQRRALGKSMAFGCCAE
jgi:hypothetical protein